MKGTLMTVPTKKLTAGFEIPVLGLGTWQMGGRETHDLTNNDQRDIYAIQSAIELGVFHIDTAESYAAGYSEILVGRAIKNFDRKKLFIVSKVHQENLKYSDLVTACEASLIRLRTNFLDLYLIHAPSDSIPMEESFAALDYLVSTGLVKYIGVSNFSTERLKAAQKLTKNKIVLNQVYYNLSMREPEHEGLIDYSQKNDILVEAYRPLEKAALLQNKNPLLQLVADKYGKTPVQVAINWLISQKMVITLVKTSSIEHLKENLGAVGWELDSADIEMLRIEFPGQQARSEHLPLR